MVIYWESSKRSLFVKTVWRNGHRHVVLEEEEEIEPGENKIKRNKLVPQSAPKPVKNALIPIKTKRCKTSTCGNSNNKILMNEIISVSPKNLHSQLSDEDPYFKSHSIDLQSAVNFYTTPCTASNQTNIINNNNLSERVMIWLDLAIQNIEEDEKYKNNLQYVSASAYPVIQKKSRTTDIKNKRMHRQLNKKQQPEISLKHANNIVTNQTVGVEKNNLSDESARPPRVSCKVEENVDGRKVVAAKKINRLASTTKRQLHIFMPNLPKRISECGDSSFSSKCSSLLRSQI